MAERGHVFTANNYYLCDNIDDENGTFDIIAELPIEGNEDFIRDIRQEDSEVVFIPITGTESVADTIKGVRSKGGRISRYVPSAKGRSRWQSDVYGVDVRRSSDSATDRQDSEKLHQRKGGKKKRGNSG